MGLIDEGNCATRDALVLITRFSEATNLQEGREAACAASLRVMLCVSQASLP